MKPMIWFFWLMVFVLIYLYVLYPIILSLRAWLFPRPIKSTNITPSVSVLIAAYNEEDVIANKLDSVLKSDYPAEKIQIIVASDGSSDQTSSIVKGYEEQGVLLLDLPRGGKAEALSQSMLHATGDILILTDSNPLFTENTIQALVAPFADPDVGGVSGNPRYIKEGKALPNTTTKKEASYWSRDGRTLKSRAGSITSAPGSLYAIRRELYSQPPAVVTDDFYISASVVEQHKRLVYAPDAIVLERVTRSIGREFKRVSRISTRSLSTVLALRQLLNPFQYGFYAVQIFTEKVLKRLEVIPMGLIFLASLFLWNEGLFFKAIVILQVAFYAFGTLTFLLGQTSVGERFWRRGRTGRWLKLLTLPGFYVMNNLAVCKAVINILTGNNIGVWQPPRANTEHKVS